MRNLNLFVAAVVSGGALVACAGWSLSAVGQESATVSLSAPTGEFAVGRAIYEWTDQSRDEMFSDVEGERRSVVATIWYPAEANDAPQSVYLPNGLGVIIDKQLGMPVSFVQVPARDDAPLAETGAAFPVLVFSPGTGSLTAMYSAMLTEIASHGYVVVAIQHPYNAMVTTFADGRVIPASAQVAHDTVQYWSEDTAFVVDELERLAAGSGNFGGRLDLVRLGAFGHSFGGATAAEFCLDDSRCVAGLNFDGSLSGDVEDVGVTQPFMLVLSGTNCAGIVSAGAMTTDACLPLLEQYTTGWRTIVDASRAGYRVTIPGSQHGSFSDLPLLAPLIPAFGDPNPTIDPKRTLEIATSYALAFFDRHLRDTGAPFPTFPDAVLEPADQQ